MNSDKQDLKLITRAIVERCFPTEIWAFNESSDAMITELLNGRDLPGQSGPKGQWAFGEELKSAAEGAQYVLQFVTALAGIYKVWVEIRALTKASASLEKQDQLLKKLQDEFRSKGMDPAQINAAAEVALEVIRTQIQQ